MASSRFRLHVASSRSPSQFSVGNAVRVPFKAGGATIIRLIHDLASSIKKAICDCKIISSDLQAFFADNLLGSTSCSIRSYAIKNKTL